MIARSNNTGLGKTRFHSWNSWKSLSVCLLFLALLLFWLRERQPPQSGSEVAKRSQTSRVSDDGHDTALRRSARLQSTGRILPDGSITTHGVEQLKDFYLLECSGHRVSIHTALKLLDEAYRDACYFSLEKPLKLQYVVEGQNDKRISFNIKGKKWGTALEYIAALAGMEVKREGLEIRLVSMEEKKASTTATFSEKILKKLWQDLIDRGDWDVNAEQPDLVTLLVLYGFMSGAEITSVGPFFHIEGASHEIAAINALLRMEEDSPRMLTIRSKLITSPQPLELPEYGLDSVSIQELITKLMQQEGVVMSSSPGVITSSGQKAIIEMGAERGEEITGTKLTFTPEPIGLKLAANQVTEFTPTDEKLEVLRSEAQFLVYAGDSQIKAIGQDAGGYHYQVTSISDVPQREVFTRQSIESILNNPNRAANHPVAMAVPGKNGFVFSPYTNQLVDVRDLPPGTLVADPHFPSEEKKFFRVP